jgi:predicted ribosome quality control (RQC) complex YloA/Tae2 family protein
MTTSLNQTFMGFDIHVGKNKQENWDIIDQSNKDDVWFHVAGGPSSHIILKSNGRKIKDIPKKVITRCACLCKAHSSSKSTPRCEIIYTQIENVTKTNHVGEVTTQNTKTITI